MPKPMRKAVEVAAVLLGPLHVDSPRKISTTAIAAVDETVNERLSREISDAVRPLRDALENARSGFHYAKGHPGNPAACSNGWCSDYTAALKEWEDVE